MKAKFNGMDLFIILVLVAAVAAGGWFLTGRRQQADQAQNVTLSMTVDLTSQEASFVDLPQVGDQVILGEKEKLETEVTNIEVLPATTLGYDTMAGRVAETTVPDRYDLRITLQGQGVETADAFEMNGNPLRVGAGVAMKNKDWAGYGFILTLDTVE